MKKRMCCRFQKDQSNDLEIQKEESEGIAVKKRDTFRKQRKISLTGWDKMQKKGSDSRSRSHSLSMSKAESQVSADSNNSKASYLEA